MRKRLRKKPFVCLIVSLLRLLIRRLRFSKQYLGNSIKMNREEEFIIFRHITANPLNNSNPKCVFIVSFKFSHLSHKANKIASIIPMLLITGFPGFETKIYAVNKENGYWQGMYQWKTMEHLEEYKKSFVFRIMNKRAISESIESVDLINQKLIDFISQNRISN